MNENSLREILANNKTENKNIDYKLTVKWGNKEKENEIIKDILSMANTQDGGRIIIGVEDKTLEITGMSDEDFNSFDNTKVNQTLKNYSDPEHNISVYKFNDFDGKKIVVINIPEYQEVPIICKKNYFNENKKQNILQEGQIYIRTESGESKTVAASSEVMREFLTRAISKKSDNLLSNIRILLKGETSKPKEDIVSLYSKEIDKTKSNSSYYQVFNKEKENLGYWELISYPSEYKDERLSLSEISKIAENAVVSKRGVSFPYIKKYSSKLQTSNTSDGVEYLHLDKMEKFSKYSYYIIESEYYSFSQDGLFWGQKLYEEDVDIELRPYAQKYSESNSAPFYTLLHFREIIFSIMEFFLFFKRYYESFMDDSESIHIEINMHDCKNRFLTSIRTPMYGVTPTNSNQEIISFKQNFKVLDLKTDLEGCASQAIEKIFFIFNSNIGPNAIKLHIKDFMELKT